MPKLKIKGWDKGRNRVALIKLLQETLGIDERESANLHQAIHDGKIISLDFEDQTEAEDFAEQLAEVGAKVEIVAE